jgi:hypothetical protein
MSVSLTARTVKNSPSQILCSVLLTALIVPVGCCTTVDRADEHPSYWQDKSILVSDRTIPELNALASDPGAGQADRARAVLSLFAQYDRPGCTSGEFARVLNNTNWLRDCRLQKLYGGAGWLPIDVTFGDTVFLLALFPSPSDKGASPWWIYFRLSGKLQESDAEAFLRGDDQAETPTRMIEFALCFPNSTSPSHLPGRIERFSSRGIHVYGEWDANPTIQRPGASRTVGPVDIAYWCRVPAAEAER